MKEPSGRDVSEFRDAVCAAERVLVAPHLHPDGDAIGAALAIQRGLEALGKQVEVVCADPVPANLRFLPGWQSIRAPEESTLVPELGILVDLNVMSRLGKAQSLFDRAPRIAIVDHHEIIEESAQGVSLVWPDYSATCLVLYEVMPQLGMEITPEIAQCLLAGIATDTGRFRFRNTDPYSLRAAADLVERGGDLTQINEEVWEKKPLPAVLLLGRALANLKTDFDGAIAYSYLTEEDFAAAEAIEEHNEGIVNEIGRVETACISALFREPKPNKVRVSVRSRGDIDVAEVCSKFGGGGHKNAAGCTFDTNVHEAIEAMLPPLREAISKSQ